MWISNRWANQLVSLAQSIVQIGIKTPFPAFPVYIMNRYEAAAINSLRSFREYTPKQTDSLNYFKIGAKRTVLIILLIIVICHWN